MKHKFEVNDVVVVYKNFARIEGDVGVIVGRDGMEKEYNVKSAVSPFAEDYWVKEEFLQRVHFDKPLNLLEKVKRFLKEI